MTTPPADDDRPIPARGPVFDHRDDRPTTSADPVAPRDDVRRRACEAHLTEFLGDDFDLLSEKVSVGIHLDLYVFRPIEEFPYLTLVTSGLADLAMNAPESLADRLELLVALPVGWPGIDPLDRDLLSDEANYWPIRLLKDIARIPSTYDSFLTWGHTIVDEDRALFAPDSPFNGAIVGPPIGYPPPLMRAVTPVGEVDYLAVFPTTQAEMDFKVATPGGGEALIDRFLENGVTAVIDQNRPSVVDGPPPWSVHILMRDRADHLGQVLDESLPNRAAALADDRTVESVIPVADEQEVRLRVSRAVAAEQLSKDGANSPLSGQVAAAISEHRGMLTLTPVGGRTGKKFSSVVSLAAMVAERSDTLAVWLPAQEYVTTAEQFVQDVMHGEDPVTFRVHPTQAPAGSTAVITRGLVALGGREVLMCHDRMAHEDLVRRVTYALNELDQARFIAPEAGQHVKYGFSKFVLSEGHHPVTGEPVLEMVPLKKKKKRGLFKRA